MTGTLAAFLSVLTFGPSEPSQHCPLLLFALRPSAWKPRLSRLLVLMGVELELEDELELPGCELAGWAAGAAAGEGEDAGGVYGATPARAMLTSLRRLEDSIARLFRHVR
jgi:hypothetical protein